MEFEVEKDLSARGNQVTDDLGPSAVKSCFPTLKVVCGVADGLDKRAGFRGAGNVQRHDQPVFSNEHRPQFNSLG